MGIKEVGCDGVERIGLRQDRDKCLCVVNTVMKLWVL